MNDGNLFTMIKGYSPQIWNPLTKEILQNLNPASSAATCSVHLPSNRLVTGLADNSISFREMRKSKDNFFSWIHFILFIQLTPRKGDAPFDSKDPREQYTNWRERRAIKKKEKQKDKLSWIQCDDKNGHSKPVFSLKALASGSFASASWDGSIKVWSPLSIMEDPLLSVDGHGINDKSIQIDALSNGNLVACSNEPTETNWLRVWDSDDGHLVKEISTGSQQAVCLLVLSRDLVAVSFANGTIKIFNLENKTNCISAVFKQSGIPRDLCQLANGYLASSTTEDKSYMINIWNLQNGQLVQTIQTGHTGNISFLSHSPDGKLLATGSKDKTTKIWSLTY